MTARSTSILALGSALLASMLGISPLDACEMNLEGRIIGENGAAPLRAKDNAILSVHDEDGRWLGDVRLPLRGVTFPAPFKAKVDLSGACPEQAYVLIAGSGPGWNEFRFSGGAVWRRGEILQVIVRPPTF